MVRLPSRNANNRFNRVCHKTCLWLGKCCGTLRRYDLSQVLLAVAFWVAWSMSTQYAGEVCWTMCQTGVAYVGYPNVHGAFTRYIHFTAMYLVVLGIPLLENKKVYRFLGFWFLFIGSLVSWFLGCWFVGVLVSWFSVSWFLGFVVSKFLSFNDSKTSWCF